MGRKSKSKKVRADKPQNSNRTESSKKKESVPENEPLISVTQTRNIVDSISLTSRSTSVENESSSSSKDKYFDQTRESKYSTKEEIQKQVKQEFKNEELTLEKAHVSTKNDIKSVKFQNNSETQYKDVAYSGCRNQYKNNDNRQGTSNEYYPIFYASNPNKSSYSKGTSVNSKAEYQNNSRMQCKDTGFSEFEKQYMNNKDNMVFKVVEEIFGDLFTAGDEYSLGHCVAEDMSMGSGIAVQFRRDFKRVDELLNQGIRQGDVAILEDKKRFIYYLVTKRISSGKPTYYTLWSSLHEMRKHIQFYGVKKLALPRIGCGLDSLEWNWVKKMLEYIFQDVDIKIVIYNFQQEADDVAPARLRKCPVVNVEYPISKIESGTVIVFFGSEDGYETPELKTIAEAWPFVRQRYKIDRKDVGNAVYINRNDGYVFYGCIVRKKYTDPFGFTYLQRCLGAIQAKNRKDLYEYVAFQAFLENDDNGLTVSKIINLMRYSLTYVHVYVCWPENLMRYKPGV